MEQRGSVGTEYRKHEVGAGEVGAGGFQQVGLGEEWKILKPNAALAQGVSSGRFGRGLRGERRLVR